MKPLSTYIPLLLLHFLLTSCYKELDMSDYRDNNGESLLTINSLVTPDSTIQLMATRTYFFSDVHNERSYVKDLDIEVLVNSNMAGTLTYNAESNLYESVIKPSSGDKVTLRTKFLGKNVETTDTIPTPVPIESITVSRKGPVSIYTNSDFVFTYNITFTDPAGEENYYFLQWDEVDRSKDIPMGERDFTHEFVFQQLASRIHSTLPDWEPYSPYGLPFSDKGLEGERHTIVVDEIVQMAEGSYLWKLTQMKRRFKLYTISKPYYNYLVSVLINQTDDKGLEGGMIDLGMADPVKIYSNIDGGVGILGCYTTAEKDVDPLETVGSFPHE